MDNSLSNIKNEFTYKYNELNNIYELKIKLLNNNEYIIPLREDGYIYATKLCKLSNKTLSFWKKMKETQELIIKLNKQLNINENSELQLIEVYKGIKKDNTNGNLKGTWIHPILGIYLAQWCDPNFALQITEWTKNIIFKNFKEIINKIKIEEKVGEKEQLLKLKEIKKKLKEQKIQEENIIFDEYQNSELKNKNDPEGIHKSKEKIMEKYRKGNAIFIMENETHDYCKIMYSSNLNKRQIYYITAFPEKLKIVYVIYCKNAKLYENLLKIKFNNYLNTNNTEIININMYKINKNEIIKSIKQYLNDLNDEYEEIANFDEIYNDLMNKEETTYEIEKKKIIKKEKIIKNLEKLTHICGCCKIEKNKSEYGIDNSKPNKLGIYCKSCLILKYEQSKNKDKIIIFEKNCIKCLILLPINNFNIKSSTKDGKQPYCINCETNIRHEIKLRRNNKKIPI
jgi:hypothetical protein